MLISISLTCKNKSEARKIANALLSKRLIACANIFMVDSLYTWEGKRVSEKEAMMVLKSTRKLLEKIKKEVRKIHSYKVIGITVEKTDTTDECMKWVREVTL